VWHIWLGCCLLGKATIQIWIRCLIANPYKQVFHTTVDLSVSLKNARKLLKPYVSTLLPFQNTNLPLEVVNFYLSK
jgi:hypothetical protein